MTLLTTMDFKVTFSFLFLVSLIEDAVFGENVAVGKKPEVCLASGIAVYRVTFQTFWSRDRFEKQYPTYRPHAQWSRVIGRIHGPDYVLWRENSLASDGLKQLAENGVSDDLDNESQGYNDIFDMFSLPRIDAGVGQTTTYVFTDRDHPLVSLASHLIPSPDWFVGLDSVSLCNGDRWHDSRKFDLKIWDAGTDKGLMFTSPNWPEVPLKPIEQITASHPHHAASSFFYGNLTELPTIATVTLTKGTVRDAAVLQRDWTAKKGERLSSGVHPPGQGQEKVKATERPEDERQGELSVLVGALPATTAHNEPVGKKTTTEATPVGSKQKTDASPSNGNNKKEGATNRKKVKLTREERRKRRMERKKKKNTKKTRRRKTSKSTRRESLVKEKVKDVDCVVSEWQPWSACSKTCGYGMRTRVRVVTTPNSGRGIRCPPLKEEEICGSMRGCGWTHFSSENWGKLKK